MKENPTSQLPDIPFVNEVRLNFKQWSAAILIIGFVLFAIPRIWKRIERFETSADYRIPYNLSRDYWLYERRLERVEPSRIVLLGDSVIWGEYVLPDGTLSHFLNEASGQKQQYVNGGVNGLFPLAIEGLVDHYGSKLSHRKVILHCNLLWMSSPKADLQVEKEEKFNHSRLVPQFNPRIPCYKADANERLSVVVERNLQFMSWVTHLQNTYFQDKSIPMWTLADDGSDPPHYPNSYKNPLSQITMSVPSDPAIDPQRGPASPRHKPWNAGGSSPSEFEWVTLNSSMQWAAFQRTVSKLLSRGDDVLVIVGPFNEAIIAKDSKEGYVKFRDGVVEWLKEQKIQYLSPAPLQSELYADASHPLTQGYQELAKRIYESPEFKNWTKENK
jgi:hypothetical protein